MWHWLTRTTTAQKVVNPIRAATTAPLPVGAPVVASQNASLAVDPGGFIGWLLMAPPPAERRISLLELEALAAIDQAIGSGERIHELLPRAPAVIPQLLGALRQRAPSLPALVERVSKDLLLAAEVMRMARSVAFSRDGEVHDLSRAITALGEQGLQRAISRVLLRPLMQSGGGKLSVLAAERLWDHTEHKSALCSVKAAAAGLDPFDGYMAGMLHSAGWTVALRLLDLRSPPPWPWSRNFVESLVARRDPLFGKVVGGWHVSPVLDALAAEALELDPARGRSPLARALLDSDRETSGRLVAAAVAAKAASEPAAAAPADTRQ